MQRVKTRDDGLVEQSDSSGGAEYILKVEQIGLAEC